jgi:hypothetical protein
MDRQECLSYFGELAGEAACDGAGEAAGTWAGACDAAGDGCAGAGVDSGAVDCKTE